MKRSGKNENPESRFATPVIGIVESFKPGEEERVERILKEIKYLGFKELRTILSWSDWYTKGGEEWYAWLFHRLAKDVSILPCFTEVPPVLGIEAGKSAPPKNPKDYADFLDVIITRFGKYFEYVELWNEPNNINNWDWRLDPYWETFSEMIGKAAYWIKQRGKKTILGGMSQVDPNWIELMCQRNVMHQIDVVGIHGYPGTWEADWHNWNIPINKVKEVLNKHGINSEIWITQTGYSTWRHDEYRQLKVFSDVMESPVQKAYWYSVEDLSNDMDNENLDSDERHYNFGLKKNDGSAKLLYRALEKEGLSGVKEMEGFGVSSGVQKETKILKVKSSSKLFKSNKPVLITGGAGFIGTNLAKRLLSMGNSVLIFDNLSRPGVEENLQWLLDRYGDQVQVRLGDIRNYNAVNEAVLNCDMVFHFAAQVAVTSSLGNPVNDFEVNVRGTLNLLEAIRSTKRQIPLLYTSTNKVYGELEDIELLKNHKRYEPVNQEIKVNGISELRILDFHSPYGCSKGAADQYIRDYARIFELPTVVFRMSCIYGPHQFGNEDQGCVAHFLIKAINKEPITIYGDGCQVRDVLYVEDLIDAMLKAHENMDKIRGRVFNMGGGQKNIISLLDLLFIIEKIHGYKPKVNYSEWRKGDQRFYVSNVNSFNKATGWFPKTSFEDGIEKLYNWITKSRKQTLPELAFSKVAQ